MKHTISYLATSALLTLATVWLTGCAKNDTTADTARQELRLTSTIAASRADIQSSAVVTGETLWAWVTDAGTGAMLYNAVALTAAADGALTSAAPMYFPQSGHAVEVSALHGSLTETVTSDTPFGAFAFTVAADQRVQTGAAGTPYVASDLLYVHQTVARTTSATKLTLYHMLSKLELQITKGAGVTDDVTSVTLDGVAVGGTFTPTTQADLADAGARGEMIATSANTTTMQLATTADASVTNDAIVVPQQVVGKTLTFTLRNNVQLVYTFPTGAEFVSGKRHLYKVTLRLTGVTVTSDIADWDDATGGSGDATMPIPPAKIGDYLLADGSWVSPTDATKAQLDKVVGVVFQTDPDRIGAGEKTALDKLGVTSPHGLAVATKTAGDALAWCTNSRDESALGILNLWNEVNVAATFAALEYDIEGYAHNAAIRAQRADYNDTTLNGGDGAYPAFKAADTFSFAPPAQSTGWYLPSVGQWFDIVRGLCAEPLTIEDSFYVDGTFMWMTDVTLAMNAAMANVPAARKTDYDTLLHFWTSSAADSQRAICMSSATSVECAIWEKTTTFAVRPVIAF